MEQDSHYYVVYLMCLAAGLDLEDAYVIAYSSQYVDDAWDGYKKKLIEIGQKAPTYFFDPIRSAHNGLESTGVEVQEKIYYPFHFLPGLHGNAFSEMMVTQPGTKGKLFVNVIDETLASKNRFRIGISLHVLADTYAHASFSGQWSWYNDISRVNFIPTGNKWKNLVGKTKWYFERVFYELAPPIGHSNAYKHPDNPALSWKYFDYSNKLQTVSNNIKFATAFLDLYEMVIGKYAAEKKKKPRLGNSHTRENEELREILWGGVNFHGNLKKRCDNWRSIILDFVKKYNDKQGQGDKKISIPVQHLHYDKITWESEVFEKSTINHPKIRKLRVTIDKFEESVFYKFHQAAKNHRAFVLDLVKNPGTVGVRDVNDDLIAQSPNLNKVVNQATMISLNQLLGEKMRTVPSVDTPVTSSTRRQVTWTPQMISSDTIEKTKQKEVLKKIQ